MAAPRAEPRAFLQGDRPIEGEKTGMQQTLEDVQIKASRLALVSGSQPVVRSTSQGLEINSALTIIRLNFQVILD